ncbi:MULTISPECIES: hypothetical protein [unclassified Streptomyces]|uniref:hypothetical protein n=1 Tax=unclassified Streptomyces TaxID=2593676 RepID=UPI0036989109
MPILVTVRTARLLAFSALVSAVAALALGTPAATALSAAGPVTAPVTAVTNNLNWD